MCPWCFSCASRHFAIPTTQSGELCWHQIASEIRESALAPATVKAYQQGFFKAEWPLDSPFRVIAFLNKAPSSDSSLKQWIAMANRIHDSRLWRRPDFTHPLVRDFINSIKRRPATVNMRIESKATLTETDLQKLFDCLQRNSYPTNRRNWAIMIVQLFGVRRASEVLTLKVNDIRLADNTVVIRGVSKKTDKRAQGIFFKLPRRCCFGFDPAKAFADYILSMKGNGNIIFPSYDVNSKAFKKETLTVNAWNRALKRLCQMAKVKVVTSHALRRAAISLSPIELVEAVAQTGGWKSLCFWEVYRRFDIDQREHAVEKIGSRNKKITDKSVFVFSRSN